VARAMPAVLLVALGGCKFREVLNAPPGPPALVVEGVLNTADTVQTVLVESSQAGDTTIGLGGAVVQLTDSTPRGCATPVVRLAEAAGPTPRPGAYTGAFCSLAPGDRVLLRVSTPDGQVVTGATEVPGLGAVSIRVGAVTAAAPDTLTMDRTRDSLAVNTVLDRARALEVEAVRTTAGEVPALNVTTDTAAVIVPGDIVQPRDSTRSVFRAGAYYRLTVAAMDSNYFDYARSATNPLTGTGFINHLDGALGVFGSVAPATWVLKVVAPQRDPREGVYHLTGTVAGAPVDATWDVYGDPIDTTSFRAFVDGQWAGGAVHTDANGDFGGSGWQGEMFAPTVTDTAFPAYLLSGTRAAAGTPFPLVVTRPGAARPDTVVAVQVSSP
jgi:Domain of unknown function (DUF4249)